MFLSFGKGESGPWSAQPMMRWTKTCIREIGCVDWVAWAWEWTGDSDMRSLAGSQATNWNTTEASA